MAKGGGGGGSRGGGVGGNFGYLLESSSATRLPDRVFRNAQGQLMGQYGSVAERIPTRAEAAQLRQIQSSRQNLRARGQALGNENLSIVRRNQENPPLPKSQFRRGQVLVSDDNKLYRVVSNPVNGIPTIRPMILSRSGTGRERPTAFNPNPRRTPIPPSSFRLTSANTPSVRVNNTQFRNVNFFPVSTSDARTLLSNTRQLNSINRQNRSLTNTAESLPGNRFYE
jgi:hypothetical protein